MLDGAPGSGWEEDDDDGGFPGEAAPLRDRAALRAAQRREARDTHEVWRPSAIDRLREARWSLAPPAAAGAVLLVAAVVVLLVLSAASAGRASVPTPTPGVAVPTRTLQPSSPPSSSSPGPPSSSSSVPGSAVSSGGAAGGEVVVDVVGEVERPGLVRLPAGSRADDAVRAAGGARPGADLRRVNLARLLVDGEQLVVPAPGEELTTFAPGAASVPATSAAAGASRTASGPVDLNHATLAELDGLPGIGPVLAQRVLDWRAAHGRFTSVEELSEVPGFGPATLARLTPLVTV
ncbi:competence protein ComEA [Quadrisphaera granulorum]|uniref:Competence protein ComEA n=1 Tax=Quadrisphaera granulorum TaxID=317664 RepID=A0A316A7V4_9ACTN|nr:helix-hairpin-helix domain-containing protein [Quadrisphaera granulorum]PWJ54006.1 competence protein ComEA [Quadrisphaera granulorum]SZE96463.1 competence protein ComEA [Quadrisphaera granulorum]